MGSAMPALGQPQTSAHIRPMSALPPKADSIRRGFDSCLSPQIKHGGERPSGHQEARSTLTTLNRGSRSMWMLKAKPSGQVGSARRSATVLAVTATRQFQSRLSCCPGSREEVFAFPRLYWLRIARPFSLKADVSAVVDLSEVVLTATVAVPGKIAVVGCQSIYLLNNPMISALASVLKCKLKPTTAADVSAFTSSLSVFTAKTVNR